MYQASTAPSGRGKTPGRVSSEHVPGWKCRRRQRRILAIPLTESQQQKICQGKQPQPNPGTGGRRGVQVWQMILKRVRGIKDVFNKGTAGGPSQDSP